MAKASEEQAVKVGYVSLRGRLNTTTDIHSLGEHASPATSYNFELAARARYILDFRDLRRRVFEDGLFADPAWDILLEIFVKDALQQRITVSGAVQSSRAPSTTGLRWLSLLEEKGLIVRQADPCHARRVYVRLSDSAFTKMRVLIEHQITTADLSI